MNNFITYGYNSVKPSDLSSKTILMIGRGDDPIKRFELGINAMSHIINEIPECEMKIISKIKLNNNLKNLVRKLNINKNIEFVGYFSDPSLYFKNASLHLFPSLAEAFPNILSETLIYGIPNILAGLDYVSTAKGGTVIIYDDSPISIAKIAIKILKNKRYRKKLGKEARNNMKKFKNDLLLKKWIKLILSIYKGESFYEELRNSDCKLAEEESLKIINNQIKLLKLRNKKFQNITIKSKIEKAIINLVEEKEKILNY
jgi:glycosyltransferase involved in cell wall biosynthesis